MTPVATAPAIPALSAYILAGGQSSRMGQNKIWIEIEAEPLIGRAMKLAHAVCETTAILNGPIKTAQNCDRSALLSCYASLVPDLIPGCGPLSGVHAALSHTQTDWNLVLPVDVPFLPVDLLKKWIAFCATPAHSASWMRLGDTEHPLPLLVRRFLGAPLEQQLRLGRWSVRAALQAAVKDRDQPSIVIYPVEQTAVSERWFTNLNSPADLQIASSGASVRLLENQTGEAASE